MFGRKRGPGGYSRTCQIFLEEAVARVKQRDGRFDTAALERQAAALWAHYAAGTFHDPGFGLPPERVDPLLRKI